MKRFKAAVVGCGNISRTHLPVLKAMQNIELVAVCDTEPEKALHCAEKYGCKAYYDFEALISDENLDCVHLCTPHYLHVPMAVGALGKGINVLCEKPCAITRQSLDELGHAVAGSSAMFGVCFQNRYNAAVRETLRIIESGRFGAVTAERADVDWFRDEAYYSDSWHGKKISEGGGVLMNQAIHTSDLLRVFAKSETQTVDAHVFNDTLKGVIDVEDSALVRYTYQNGVVAVLSATNGFSLNANVSIELFFESGARLLLDGLDLYLTEGTGSFEKLRLENGGCCHGNSYWGNGHAALIEDFYRCVETGEHFPVDFEQGAKAVRDVLAAYESSQNC